MAATNYQRVGDLISSIEGNPWILAIAVITANIGAGFILDDLTEEQQKFLNNCFTRKIIIFSIVYISTRNIGIALMMTLIYSLFVHWI